MNKIRVIHIITTLNFGGAEKQLVILAREQITLGYEVFVVPIKGLGELETTLALLGANVKNEFSNIFFARIAFGLHRFIRKNPDLIVHAHLPRAELVSRFALWFLSNPFLVTRHNSEQFFPKSTKLISRIISRWVVRRANATIAISAA